MRMRSSGMLLNLLPGSGVIPTMDKMSELLQVSQRTLRSDLEEVNNFLSTIGQPHYFVDYLGVIKSRQDQDTDYIREKLFNIGAISYKFSPDERQRFILAALLDDDNYTTMESLADAVLVSRVTILSDIEFIKSFLEQYPGVELSTRSSKGVRMECAGESELRGVLLDLFRKIVIKISAESIFLHIFMRRLDMRYTVSDIAGFLRLYEKEHDLLFSEESFYEISLYLLVALNRHLSGRRLEGPGGGPTPEAEHLADIIRFFLEKTGGVMEEEQITLVSRGMDAGQINLSTRRIVDIELYNVITYFLSKVGEKFDGVLQKDLLLVDSLHKHIKTMSETMNLGFDFSKEKEFQGEYWELLEEINKNAFILEKYLSRKISERMKLSIFIHICAALVRNKKYLAPLHVLVVCPGSMATGRLVEAQIRNFFDFNIREVVSADKVLTTLTDSEPAIDFVIATVELGLETCPVVIVNPVLTMDDFNQIQKMAFAIGRANNKKDGVKGRMLRIVDRLLDEVDEERTGELINDIKKLADKYSAPPGRESDANVAQMLDSGNILIVEEALDWRRAIRLGGGLLRDGGYVEESYIDDMIDNVEQYGPYIIIGGRLALAHSKPGDNVHAEGLSLVLSREGVRFDGGESVHPVLCLSLDGDKEYLPYFQQIMHLGESDAFIWELLRAATPEEVHAVVARYCGEVRGE